MDIKKWAQKLDAAAMQATPIEQISTEIQYSEDQAYQIQLASMQERYGRGDELIGLKLGFTSYAKMEQMGVHDMIWGRLTQNMLVENGGSIDLSNFIHPRAEPEICFKLSKDLDREITLEEAPDFVEGVAAAIEIIDSRYQNFKFSLEDVVADNCSSSAFVVGTWHKPDTNIQNLLMQLLFDEEEVAKGSSNDILGNPWLSVVNAARLAKKYDQPFVKGSYLMAGASTPAIFIKPKTEVIAKVEGFSVVSFNVN
ncbi:MAG: 2-keto-4-pentenoate hydratase [Bacteroidia bacterium]|jgi:2-keto-4-pentenoate hydratase